MKKVFIVILVLAAMAAVQSGLIRERRQIGFGFYYPGAASIYGDRQQEFLHSDAGEEYKKVVVPALCGAAGTVGGAAGAICSRIPTK